MAIPQSKLREIVFIILYSYDFVENDKEGVIERIMTELRVTKKVVYSAFSFVEKIWIHKKEIDEEIDQFSKEYAFDRITRIELNALRLGLFEIQYEEKPKQVAISEAMRIAKKFGSPEGAKFVNAILDGLCKEQSV